MKRNEYERVMKKTEDFLIRGLDEAVTKDSFEETKANLEALQQLFTIEVLVTSNGFMNDVSCIIKQETEEI
jgi:hypothetical protein